MHLNELRADNFKRLHAVRLTFPEGGGTVEIAGRNGAGKSSTLDAIAAALGGKRACPEEPIRTGARSARTELDLGEYRVVREWDRRGTRLTVTGTDDVALSSPQALLDRLFARIAFDPLAFMRQDPAEQARTLRQVCNLDFRALDEERARCYAERTDVNRAVKQQEARLFEMPEVEPTEPVELEDLQKALEVANVTNVNAAGARQKVQSALMEVEAARRVVDAARSALLAAVARHDEAMKRVQELPESIPENIDTAPLVARIRECERTNARARAYRDRQAALEELRSNRGHSEDLTLELDRIDRERAAALAAAKMPIEGLSLDSDGQSVLFRGVPLAQASSSEQIRIGLAIGAALAPTLRLIIIREGSLLDEPTLRAVAAWAEEHDYQVLVERVADATIGAGVVIEEGYIRGAPRPATPAREAPAADATRMGEARLF